MYDHGWVFFTMFYWNDYNGWPGMTIGYYGWPRMIIGYYGWARLIIDYYGWPRLTIGYNGWIWLTTVVYFRAWMSMINYDGNVWPCMDMVEFVLPCLIRMITMQILILLFITNNLNIIYINSVNFSINNIIYH